MAEGGGLLNRYTASKPYRGFESLRLRQLLLRQDYPKTIHCRRGSITGRTLANSSVSKNSKLFFRPCFSSRTVASTFCEPVISELPGMRARTKIGLRDRGQFGRCFRMNVGGDHAMCRIGHRLRHKGAARLRSQPNEATCSNVKRNFGGRFKASRRQIVHQSGTRFCVRARCESQILQAFRTSQFSRVHAILGGCPRGRCVDELLGFAAGPMKGQNSGGARCPNNVL